MNTSLYQTTRLAIVLALFAGCAKDQSSSELHQIQLQFGTFSTAQSKIWNLFVPEANASVASLKMCFKRLRFKLAESADDSSSGIDDSPSGSDDSSSDDNSTSSSKTSSQDDSSSDSSDDSNTVEDNIDFNIGEVSVSEGSTSLGSIQLPAGNYRRVEFDLESSCASGKSISVVNSNGSFSTTDRITIKFEGNFTVQSDGTLTLGVQQILSQLNNYNGNGTIKSAVESTSGVLSN